MSGRKRKASDVENMDRMSTSPSPRMTPRTLPNTPILAGSSPSRSSSGRLHKRPRSSSVSGHALHLPRLLETLSAADMRHLLQTICEENPVIAHEVVSKAPRPSVGATLTVLQGYETAFTSAFPFGNRASSDYTYHRVRHQYQSLIDALREYTPHFLPPNETQPSTTMSYLDAVTSIVHRVPEWETPRYNATKNDAYEEISSAWVLAIRESAKRGGGFALQFRGWDQKILKHNQLSGGRLQAAVDELQSGSAAGWSGNFASPIEQNAQGPLASDERAAIRQQLMSGTYGVDVSVTNRRW